MLAIRPRPVTQCNVFTIKVCETQANPTQQNVHVTTFYTLNPSNNCTKCTEYAPFIPEPSEHSQSYVNQDPVTMKRPAVIAITITVVILTVVILLWRFWPASSSPPIHLDGPGDDEIIEENAVISLFSGSNFLKGGTGSFLTLGLLAAAVYLYRKKKQRSASSALAPNAPTAPATSTQPRNYSPSAPAFNQFLSPAIEMQMQPHPPPPPGPLTREQLTAILMAGVPPASSSTTTTAAV